MTQQPRAEDLGSCPLFGGLSLEHRRHFAARIEVWEVAPGQVIYEEGDLAQELYVVVSGKLEAAKPSLAQTFVLSQMSCGDFFGDMSLIDMQPRSATVYATETCVLWRLGFGAVREVYGLDIKAYTLLVMNIARELSRRLRRADVARLSSQVELSRLGRQRDPRRSVVGMLTRIGTRITDVSADAGERSGVLENLFEQRVAGL
jgi:CRP-like cAMP-binding protein